MCTAITYNSGNHYFGRNLDVEGSYDEEIIIAPKNFQFKFRKMPEIKEHYAIIGAGIILEDYPLFFDATNEAGLSVAGLSFSGNAVYYPKDVKKDNITPFEFIPWILADCKSVLDAKKKLCKLNLLKLDFNKSLTLSPLHWMIADKKSSITVEPLKEGLRIYDNPVGVLTNNPTFDIQMFNLNNYIHLSNKAPENNFSEKLPLNLYSRGMGALGLPGDLSSSSRFVKAVFTKLNSVSGKDEEESVNQFFHILGSVYQQRGCVDIGKGVYEITEYSSCCNIDKGIYYYKTYENSSVTGVDMHKENLFGKELISYPMVKKGQFFVQN